MLLASSLPSPFFCFFYWWYVNRLGQHTSQLGWVLTTSRLTCWFSLIRAPYPSRHFSKISSDLFSQNHTASNYPQIFVFQTRFPTLLSMFYFVLICSPQRMHCICLQLLRPYAGSVCLPVNYVIDALPPSVLFLSVVKYGTASSTAVLLISSSDIWTLFPFVLLCKQQSLPSQTVRAMFLFTPTYILNGPQRPWAYLTTAPLFILYKWVTEILTMTSSRWCTHIPFPPPEYSSRHTLPY